ncbi:MAG: hypothetical protein ACPGTS_00810, partial [Minisyncoccia bacterium]
KDLEKISVGDYLKVSARITEIKTNDGKKYHHLDLKIVYQKETPEKKLVVSRLQKRQFEGVDNPNNQGGSIYVF